MSLLNSKFDIVSVDNPVALASLAQVLDTSVAVTYNTNGTPVAGTIQPGMIVTMNASGQAILGTSPTLGGVNVKKLLTFVVVDGNVDYSGAFTQKLTVLHGGITIETDQITGSTFAPGDMLTYASGLLAKTTTPDTAQVIGYVGPAGYNATTGVLQAILPQGCGL